MWSTKLPSRSSASGDKMIFVNSILWRKIVAFTFRIRWRVQKKNSFRENEDWGKTGNWTKSPWKSFDRSENCIYLNTLEYHKLVYCWCAFLCIRGLSIETKSTISKRTAVYVYLLEVASWESLLLNSVLKQWQSRPSIDLITWNCFVLTNPIRKIYNTLNHLILS